MSWLFSQALVEEFSVATSLDGEPCAQLNVMPTPHKFWRSDKTIEPSDHSRFGLTSRVLTESRGKELLTSFLAGFHVRTSARPGKVLASMVPDQGYGTTWLGLLARYDPESFLWRTAQSSLLGDSDEFSGTWPRSGMTRSGMSYLRPTLVPSISGNESGLWQTPVADDAVERLVGKYNSRGEPKLSAEVKLWPTPKATIRGDCPSERRRRSPDLASVVAMWPTPNASDASKWSNQSLAERKAKGQQVRLNTAVSPEGGMGGQLNPEWVEWLMGFPIGWTVSTALEMPKFHEWQQQHSIYSADKET